MSATPGGVGIWSEYCPSDCPFWEPNDQAFRPWLSADASFPDERCELCKKWLSPTYADPEDGESWGCLLTILQQLGSKPFLQRSRWHTSTLTICIYIFTQWKAMQEYKLNNCYMKPHKSCKYNVEWRRPELPAERKTVSMHFKSRQNPDTVGSQYSIYLQMVKA